jgi:3-phosphoglycerate kinase
MMMAAGADFEVKDGEGGKEFREQEAMNLSKKVAIDDIPDKIKDARVLMRVDFNVPMKDGEITDPKRIVSTIPSIKYLLDNGAKSVVLMSHLGRPNGQKNDKFSLKPVVGKVSELVGKMSLLCQIVSETRHLKSPQTPKTVKSSFWRT